MPTSHLPRILPSSLTVGRLSISLAWVIAISMLLTVTAWTVGWAPYSFFRWVNAFAFYAYLPALPLAIAALMARKHALAGTFGVVFAVYLVVVTPSHMPVDIDSTAAANERYMMRTVGPGNAEVSLTQVRTPDLWTRPLKIFYANVGRDAASRPEMAKEIEDANPDIIVLTEYSKGWHNWFNEGQFPVEYPYHIHLPDYTPGATGIYSRVPLYEENRIYESHRVLVNTTVHFDGGKLEILGIHAPRPINSPLHHYNEFWDLVKQELAKRSDSGPLLLLGDFNATPQSLIYRDLTAGDRLVGCHELVGRSYASTWPNGTKLLPPIRIDHALVTPDVRCVSMREGIGTGSDHKPLIFELSLPRDEPANLVTLR